MTISKLSGGAMANLSNWYESKSLSDQALVDIIGIRTCFVVGEQRIDSFLLILSSYDIRTEQQFIDSFFAEYSGHDDGVLGQFVKHWSALAKGCLPRKLLKQHNAELIWQEVIQFDFHRFIFNGNTYFFKRNF